MAKIENIKKNNILKPSTASGDLLALFITLVVVFVATYSFNLFNFLMRLFQQNPKAIEYIDEIILVLLTLSIGLAIFAWRRWLELKKEAAERIKKQEELLKIAETNAEVERIISRQLRNDMDEVREEVREILALLSKNKRAQ